MRCPAGRRLRLLLPLLGLLVAPDARAGGFSISILGARRTGALTNLAAPDDVTALFHNPAGLADQPGTRAHVSGSMTFMDTRFRMRQLDPARFPALSPADWPVDAEGYYQAEIEPESYFGVLPYVGLSQDLGFFGPRARDVVVSLAVTAPNLYGANLPADAPTAYNFTEGFFATVSTTLGAGWRVNEHVAVGAALSYNYMKLTYAQRFSLMDLLLGEDPTPADVSMAMAAQMGIGDISLDYGGEDHGLGWNLGLLLSPSRHVSFGFSYNGATSARFEGALKIDAVKELQADFSALARMMGIKMPTGLIVEMAIPHSLQAGVNVKPVPWVELGFDLRLWLYNLYDKQVLQPLYDPAAEGTEPMTTEELSKDKDYGLSYEVALGLVLRPFRRLRTLDLMAGVGFDKSPVPGKSFSLDNPSMNQLVVTTGARWQVTPRWRVAATYLFDYYLPRDIRHNGASPPMNVQVSAIGHTPRLELECMF